MTLGGSDDDVFMGESISNELGEAWKGLGEKGKPMRRFLSHSPFEYGQVHARDSLVDDAVYAKVLNVAWENDILWGIDFGNRNRPGCSQLASIEEEEEDDRDGRGRDRVDCQAVDIKNHSQLQSKIGGRGSSKRPLHNDCSINQSAPSPHQGEPPRSHTAETDTPYSVTNLDSDFDMTKPRHYRWELSQSTGAISTKACLTGKTTNNGVQTSSKLPSPLNMELYRGSWVNAIGWNSPLDMPDTKLILDDNDDSIILVDADELPPIIRVQELSVRSLGFIAPRVEMVADDLYHSLSAIKLSMTKPELPKAKLREFHRPRSKFKINERMVFSPPPVVPVPPVEEGAVVTQIKKSSDLNLTAGGKIILVEYTEQNPPMLSNPGMASRILHYWRPPDNEEDVLVGKKKVKKAKPKAPEMKMGQVITLGHHDETPFVGDVPPGRVVTSLNSKLYKVPIFQHKPVAPFAPTTSVRESNQYELFLLCRSVSKSKKGAAIGESAKTTMYAFEMPDLYLAGQIEPQIEVPAPNSDLAKKFIQSYTALHVCRMLNNTGCDQLKFENVQRAFPSQSSTAIRKAMKVVATFERGGADSGSWRRHALVDGTFEEALLAKLTPESVCLHESMMAGQRRLLDIGLRKHFTTKGIEGAIDRLLKRLELRKRTLSVTLVEPLQLPRRQKARAESDVWKRDATICKLERDIQVARYILHELQLTPWNLTGNYVECHLQGKGLLALGGVGDPTGRGDGFSFVRASQQRGKTLEGQPQTATRVEKAVASVTGTTADLRKLKMREAGLVLRNLGVPESEIATLKRWERVQRLREISTTATARGEGGALSKFARGGRKSMSEQQQEYRRKCDAIYERQLDILSSTNLSFPDEDEQSQDESDSMDDLEEELLGAVSDIQHDRQRIRNLIRQRLEAKETSMGLHRSRGEWAERDEAIELARLMREMEDDLGDAGTSIATSANAPVENRSRCRSPIDSSNRPFSTCASDRASGRKVLKRTTRVVEEDGTETVRIEFIVDDGQVARFQAMQQHQNYLEKAQKLSRTLSRKRDAGDGHGSSEKRLKNDKSSVRENGNVSEPAVLFQNKGGQKRKRAPKHEDQIKRLRTIARTEQ